MIRPDRWFDSDDLALVGDRFVIAICIIAIALYALNVIN